MALKITNGAIKRAQKIVIYGPEGIGKTTFASQFPDPLFIDTEGGSSHLDVSRTQTPISFSELCGIVQDVWQEKGCCKTLVIDTVDWAEQLCISDVCIKNKKTGIEEFGYGKGYTYVMEEFGMLISALNNVIKAGINVVLVAHAMMRKFEQPDEMGSYDRWEMKLSKKTAQMVKEWADCILFCTYETIVVKDSETNKNKPRGGKRVIYTTHNPCWDAKNRYGLPDKISMDYKKFCYVLEDAQVESEKQEAKKPEEKKEENGSDSFNKIKELMKESRIAPFEVSAVVGVRKPDWGNKSIKDYSEKTREWIIRNWAKIVDMITTDPNRVEPTFVEIENEMEAPF